MAAGEVVNGLFRGVWLELHPPGDYVSDVIRDTGDFYEADILDELRRRLEDRPAGVVVDAGAMIGNHSAYLAAFARYTALHAFEPVASNVELLTRNLEPWPGVHVHPVALSSREQLLRFVLETDNRGHHRVDPAGDVQVRAFPLDAFRLAGVSLLKVDVEGHELEVLAGARATIELWHPLIVVEDWPGTLGSAMPAGYVLAAEWAQAHQTYLYEWAGY